MAQVITARWMMSSVTGQTLQVSLAELRRSFEMLLRCVESITGPDVILDKDYFWSIPLEVRYDVDREPTDLTVGQISESLEHLRRLLANPDAALPYYLVWLADVLHAIGQDPRPLVPRPEADEPHR